MSSQEQYDELVARIEHLEGQNYGLKRVGMISLVLLFIVGASLVYTTWAELGAVVTQAVILNDQQGPRYALTVNAQNALGVVSYRAGVPPGLVKAPELVQGLVFYDSQGRVRIALGMSQEGDQPRLVVYDEGGKPVWQAVDLKAAAETPAASPSPAAPSPSPEAPGGSASPGPKPSAKPNK
jgi:hypothetical protein